jgi:hypothetical protein
VDVKPGQWESRGRVGGQAGGCHDLPIPDPRGKPGETRGKLRQHLQSPTTRNHGKIINQNHSTGYGRGSAVAPTSWQRWGPLSSVASHLSKVLGHNTPKIINPHQPTLYDRDLGVRPRSSQSWGALSPVASHLSKVLGHNAPEIINQQQPTLYDRGSGVRPRSSQSWGPLSPVAIKVLGHNSPKTHHHNNIIIIINQCHPGICLQQLPGSCPAAACPAAGAACRAAAWKLPGICLHARPAGCQVAQRRRLSHALRPSRVRATCSSPAASGGGAPGPLLPTAVSRGTGKARGARQR